MERKGAHHVHVAIQYHSNPHHRSLSEGSSSGWSTDWERVEELRVLLEDEGRAAGRVRKSRRSY
jgi:hypothetical protein